MSHVCKVLLELPLTEKSDLWLLWLKSNFEYKSFPIVLSFEMQQDNN